MDTIGMRIAGTGSALPERIITNDDLAAVMDTNDEWISTRTGIRERRILSDGEALTELAAAAARSAIDDAGIAATALDLVIVTTVGGDYKTPSMSCLVAGALGADCTTLDINMACCGFVYALNTVYAYIRAGMAKNALVVSAEALSRLVDWSDRSTCVLFGDGAGAVVLTSGESVPVFDLKLEAGDGWRHLTALRATDSCPYNSFEDKGFMHMDGQEIYKFAVSSITARIDAVLRRSGASADDIAAFLLHQANLRIIRSAVSRFNINEKKFPHNIECRGNTSSASIPILLDEQCRAGAINPGDRLVLCAFGAGLSSSACLISR